MKKFELGKDYLILAILTLLTVLSWTALTIYQSAKRTTIPKVTQEQLTPLDPQLPVEVIEKIRSGLTFR